VTAEALPPLDDDREPDRAGLRDRARDGPHVVGERGALLDTQHEKQGRRLRAEVGRVMRLVENPILLHAPSEHPMRIWGIVLADEMSVWEAVERSIDAQERLF